MVLSRACERAGLCCISNFCVSNRFSGHCMLPCETAEPSLQGNLLMLCNGKWTASHTLISNSPAFLGRDAMSHFLEASLLLFNMKGVKKVAI